MKNWKYLCLCGSRIENIYIYMTEISRVPMLKLMQMTKMIHLLLSTNMIDDDAIFIWNATFMKCNIHVYREHSKVSKNRIFMFMQNIQFHWRKQISHCNRSNQSDASNAPCIMLTRAPIYFIWHVNKVTKIVFVDSLLIFVPTESGRFKSSSFESLIWRAKLVCHICLFLFFVVDLNLCLSFYLFYPVFDLDGRNAPAEFVRFSKICLAKNLNCANFF